MQLIMDVLLAAVVVLDGLATWKFMTWFSFHFYRLRDEAERAYRANADNPIVDLDFFGRELWRACSYSRSILWPAMS